MNKNQQRKSAIVCSGLIGSIFGIGAMVLFGDFGIGVIVFGAMFSLSFDICMEDKEDRK